MPEIQAFRGLRYDLARVGSLSDVIAPPYDVVDSELQNHLYNLSPYNFLRLELNRAERVTPTRTRFTLEQRTSSEHGSLKRYSKANLILRSTTTLRRSMSKDKHSSVADSWLEFDYNGLVRATFIPTSRLMPKPKMIG